MFKNKNPEDLNLPPLPDDFELITPEELNVLKKSSPIAKKLKSVTTRFTTKDPEDDTDSVVSEEIEEEAEKAIEEELIEEGVTASSAREISEMWVEEAKEEGIKKRDLITSKLSGFQNVLREGLSLARKPKQYGKKEINRILLVKRYITQRECEVMNGEHTKIEKMNNETKNLSKRLKNWKEIHSYQIKKICDFLLWLAEQENVSYHLFSGKTISDVMDSKKNKKLYISIPTQKEELPESVTEMILKLKKCIEDNKSKNNRKKFKNCLLKSEKVTKEGVNNRIYRKILLCKQYIETMELISKASAEGQLEGYTLLLGMLSNDDGIGEFLDMFNECDLIKQE